ncbi:MAG: alpha/beta fold hydrolase [Nitrospirae bacterium]|nr:alpha/beta fold hydrolase [Nitrospirota bacterium]
MSIRSLGVILLVVGVAALVAVLPVFHPRDWQPWTDAIKEAPGQLVKTKDHTTHVVVKGEGPPAILIHGFMYHSIMWEGTQRDLTHYARTHAMDLYGWGYSSRLDAVNYSYDLYARQVIDLMDSLGIERADLIGQSMGGGTAMVVAARWPQRVRSLILVDPAGLPNPLPLTGRIFGLQGVGEFLVALPGRSVFKKNLQDFWFHDASRVTDEYVDAVIRPFRITGSTRTILNILRTLDFGSLEGEVRTLAGHHIPTLVVWGREDRAVPLPIGEKLHHSLPGSQFFVVDGAGHSPHEEKPEIVHPRLIEFLKSLPAPPAP